MNSNQITPEPGTARVDNVQSAGESSVQSPIAAAAPPATNAGMEWSGKTVLLVNSNLRTRESRAKILRSKGVHVDCVPNAEDARMRLAAAQYNLILVDLGREVDVAESLVREIKTKNPRQSVGFLVGSPLFVATSLNRNKSRPRLTPTSMPARVEKAATPAVPGDDFGKRVRDAETAQLNDPAAVKNL